jgi:hypothetical protein
MLRQSNFYCAREENGGYHWFGGAPINVQGHAPSRRDLNIIPVIVQETCWDTETTGYTPNFSSPYYGYWCNTEQRFKHIYPSLNGLLLMSFDFFKSSIAAGEGEILNVEIFEMNGG